MHEVSKNNKSLGQHWLRDAIALDAMCDAAEVSSKDTVLEIGPGLGTLTDKLLERAKHVIAVEFDNNLSRQLSKKYKSHNIEIVQQDILKFDLTKMPADYKAVANIPYYITSNLIRVLSESPNPPKVAVLLVQKEVAERVAAIPGEMSILSVTAQFFWEVSLGRVVRAELFEPPPKVDSQILKLKRRDKKLFPDVDEKSFFRIVKAGFSQRRKTLLNSLSAGLHIDKLDTEKILHASNIPPSSRAQSLSLAQWSDIYHVLVNLR